jgi:hypothetical protein
MRIRGRAENKVEFLQNMKIESGKEKEKEQGKKN